MALLGAAAHFGVIERMVVVDDAAQTASNVAGSETLFRLAIAALLVVAGLDVVAAWALFAVFAPVSPGLSMLSAWFRLLYSAVFVAAIAQLAGVLDLVRGGEALWGHALREIHGYEGLWHVGLVLFGFHLILLGVLVRRAAYAPSVLGLLLVGAGLGYATDGFGQVLLPDYGLTVAAYTFLGELGLDPLASPY